MVSFTFRQLCHRGKSSRYSLDRKLAGWTTEPAWMWWQREKFPATVGNPTPVVQPVD